MFHTCRKPIAVFTPANTSVFIVCSGVRSPVPSDNTDPTRLVSLKFCGVRWADQRRRRSGKKLSAGHKREWHHARIERKRCEAVRGRRRLPETRKRRQDIRRIG